ncbi:ubiquitin carboxyl-terminal hydrolase 16-like [Planococcus citri]|uniref:ubiquitin carboxyl-terminal hydrolase 16-like n=1 Tax=Planococcus citri TaxID=170843 RepID=UPI0031F8B3FE
MAGTEEQTQDADSPEKLITNKSCWNSHQVHFSLPSADPTPASKSGCQHINKAIDATSVRKAIIRAGGFASLRCVSCVAESASDSEEIEKDLSLCLKCGASNCNDHLLKHFEILRSDPHTLCVKIEDWSVRCCKCDIDVPVENNGKLKEGINILKQEQRKPSRVKPKPKKATFEMTDSKPSSVASVDVP